jgi:hypothetical protein
MKKKYEGDQPTTNDPNVYTSKEWQRIAPTMLIGNRTKQVSDTLSTHVLRDGVGVPLCALGHLGIFQSSTACLHQTPPLHPTISGVGPMSFCFISFHHMSSQPPTFFFSTPSLLFVHFLRLTLSTLFSILFLCSILQPPPHILSQCQVNLTPPKKKSS